MDGDFTNIKIHANRCICGLGHVIRIGKTKYMQTDFAVVLVMADVKIAIIPFILITLVSLIELTFAVLQKTLSISLFPTVT